MHYYIHGYLSSPESTKGSMLNEKIGVKPVKYRDCKPEDLVVKDCVKRIIEGIEDDNHAVLIGSSLGGLLAAKTAYLKPQNIDLMILLNPAIIPPDFDISSITDMPHRILKDMQDERLFEKKINIPIYIIRGTEDKVVPDEWIYRYAKKQEATVKFIHDDHRISKNISELPIMIKQILKLENDIK
ncbi:MAG: YqiA/YcfP family alpha/beta fold hydrolase [Candidatus Thermoplasmatota archaeon]